MKADDRFSTSAELVAIGGPADGMRVTFHLCPDSYDWTFIDRDRGERHTYVLWHAKDLGWVLCYEEFVRGYDEDDDEATDDAIDNAGGASLPPWMGRSLSRWIRRRVVRSTPRPRAPNSEEPSEPDDPNDSLEDKLRRIGALDPESILNAYGRYAVANELRWLLSIPEQDRTRKPLHWLLMILHQRHGRGGST